MNSKGYLKKHNHIEMHLYELLGIKWFKKAVLLLERIKHSKDAILNENYHPQDTSKCTLIRFSGYLIYNAIIHITSLIFVFIYFVIMRILSLDNIVIDIFMIIVIILNLYCIMLQRYIYLKIRQLINKKQQTAMKAKVYRTANIVNALRDRPPEKENKEIEFLQKMQTQILSGKDFVLTDDSEQILLNIAELLKPITSIEENTNSNIAFADLISELPAKALVISTMKYRISHLQNAFRFDKTNNVLFGVCVVTSSSAIEEAYKTIFPNSTLDSVLETIDVLLDAYLLSKKEKVSKWDF